MANKVIVSKPVTDSAVEAAMRQLNKTNDLLSRFGVNMPTETLCSLVFEFQNLTDCEILDQQFVDEAFALRAKVNQEALIAQVKQIRDMVERKYFGWANSRFGGQFVGTSAQFSTTLWLNGASSNQEADVKAWVNVGWSLYKGDLKSPWGRCDCGKTLVPVTFTDRKTGEKRTTVFDTCRECHAVVKTPVMAATQGKTAPQPAKKNSACKRWEYSGKVKAKTPSSDGENKQKKQKEQAAKRGEG